MDNMSFLWIFIIILAAVTEAFTNQLVSIWFVFGGILALITSLFTPYLWMQIAVFVVVSLFTLIFTRPFIKKFIALKKTNTNIDRYIGEKVKVLEEINNEEKTGLVSISGVVWNARSVDGLIVPKDEYVIIESIEGTKLYVKPVKYSLSSKI